MEQIIWKTCQYPNDFTRIRSKFNNQNHDDTCGPAAVMHGFLLGGMYTSEASLSSIFDTYKNGGTDGDTIQERLNELGFDVRLEKKKTKEKTIDFINRMNNEMKQGAFILSCIYGGEHWVCIGAYENNKLLGVDSDDSDRPIFFHWTPQQFDDKDWENCVRLVLPGKHKKSFQEWVPARLDLLRAGNNSTKSNLLDQLNDAIIHLNDEAYAYTRLDLFLRNSKETPISIYSNSDDPIMLADLTKQHAGSDRAISIRSISGKEPIVVVRMDKLSAFQLVD